MAIVVYDGSEPGPVFPVWEPIGDTADRLMESDDTLKTLYHACLEAGIPEKTLRPDTIVETVEATVQMLLRAQPFAPGHIVTAVHVYRMEEVGVFSRTGADSIARFDVAPWQEDTEPWVEDVDFSDFAEDENEEGS